MISSPNRIQLQKHQFVKGQQKMKGIHTAPKIWMNKKKSIPQFQQLSMTIYSNSRQPFQQLKIQTIKQQESLKNTKKQQLFKGTLRQQKILNENCSRKTLPLRKNIANICEFDSLEVREPCTDIETNDEEDLFTVVYKKGKNNGKTQKQSSWFKKFIKKNAEIKNDIQMDDHESSFQIISKNSPCPHSYNIQDCNENILSHTFSKKERFLPLRPLTATSQFQKLDLNNKAKKTHRNDLSHVSFGTSLNNLRSQIQQIQICQWKRSHCCENAQGMAEFIDKKSKNLDPYFSSNSQRFPTKKNYSKKDFYNIQGNSKKQRKIPAHYFISSNYEEQKPSVEDERNFYGQQMNTISQNINKTLQKNISFNQKAQFQPNHVTKYQQLRRNYLKQDIPDQIPKNSIGKSHRKCLNARKMLYHPIIDRPKSCNKNMKTNSNAWMKSSFNIKFQGNAKSPISSKVF